MKYWKNLFAFVAVVALGLVFGGAIRKYVTPDRQAERERLRHLAATNNDRVVGPLEIGVTLDDHTFEDLNEQPVRLSDLVVGNMLICIVMPVCESCLDEMLYIRDQIDKPEDYRHLVFITSANPRFMRDIKMETGMPATFLYDHRAAYLSHYGVDTYPFNIIIDSNMIVLDVFGGGLTQADLEKVLP